MAEEQPGNDVSSYSDPIYDRIERINRALARHWRILVIIVLVIVAAVTTLSNMDSSSPEALSATAYSEAADDSEKLQAVANDENILAEFRFKAANDLLQQALADNKIEEANKMLTLVEAQAKAADSSTLKMHALMSKGSIQSQSGEFDAAIATYGEALRLSRSSEEKSAKYMAQFNKAALEIRQADKNEDQEIAKELRTNAYYALDQLRNQEDINNTSLQQAAEYAYYDLIRSHPSLVDDGSSESTEEETAPAE